MTQPTIYAELEQGTEEWLQARCGIITASVIGQLITSTKPGAEHYICPDCGVDEGEPCVSKVRKADAEPKPIKTMHPARHQAAADFAGDADPILTVDHGETARKALLRLAAERISGHVEDSFLTLDMQRGVIDEPKCRAEYEERHSVTVDEIGFMTVDVNGVTLGYSPDGLVGTDGLIECKSRRQSTQLEHWLNGEVPAENMAQLQTGLYVSGRKWIDYLGFAEGWATLERRVYPDPAWFDAIEQAVAYADTFITEAVDRYEALTTGLTPSERTPDITDLEF